MKGKEKLLEATVTDAEHLAVGQLRVVEENYLSRMGLEENPDQQTIRDAWKTLVDEEGEELYYYGWESFEDTYNDFLPADLKIDDDAFEKIRNDICEVYASAFSERTLQGILEHFGHKVRTDDHKDK